MKFYFVNIFVVVCGLGRQDSEMEAYCQKPSFQGLICRVTEH
jgi:hypothetical protein